MVVYNLNGIRIKLNAPDLDGDGQVNTVENLSIRTNNDIQPISNPAETKEAMKELNEDVLDGDTRMSSIDMKTRLKSIESMFVHAFDSMVGLKIAPVSALVVTRQKKRLNVSLDGLGRKEQVELAVGTKKNLDDQKSMLGNFTGMGK